MDHLDGPPIVLDRGHPPRDRRLFLNPLEIPNINTLAQIKRKGYITFK